MQFIKKVMPSWFPVDLIKPLMLLSGCSLLIIVLFLSPFFHMKLQRLWWLPWNLFLAWLPLFFALIVLRIDHGKKRIQQILVVPFLTMWFLFLPNAPYMLTNLVHLNRFEFYTLRIISDQYIINYSEASGVWFVFLVLISSVAIGCGVGFLSLIIIQRHINEKHGVIWEWVMVTGSSLFSGVAIWIGIILKFRSWDFIFRPYYLLRNVIAEFSWNAFLLCIIYAIMSIVGYTLMRSFLNKGEN